MIVTTTGSSKVKPFHRSEEILWQNQPGYASTPKKGKFSFILGNDTSDIIDEEE